MHLLRLIWEFFVIQVRRNLEYRFNALIGTVAIAIGSISSVLFLWVVFTKIPDLNGWTLGQILFISGTSSLAWGIQHAFMSGLSGWNLQYYIRHGMMDRVLLRPINTAGLMMMSESFDIDGLGDVIAGLAIVIVASSMIAVNWTTASILLYFILVFSASVILASIHLLIGTISFWTVQSGSLFDIIFTLTRFSDYPLEIFNPATRFVLTFIMPIAFTSYYPAQIFIGKGIWMEAAYLTPVVAVIMLAISYSFFKYGLKRYSSTGS